MKRILAFLMVTSIGIAHAACTGASPSWNTTPDQTSVQTCLGKASRGDTVNVAAGSATWSLLTITKGVTLRGAGAGSTVITIGTSNVGCGGGSQPANGSIVCVIPDATAISGSENIKIIGFTFSGGSLGGKGSGYGLIWVFGATYNAILPYRNIIIANNTIENTGTTAGNGNTGIYVTGQVRGLVTNNTFDDVEMPWRVFGNDDIREYSDPAYYPFSYGSSDNLYIEDNTIQYSMPFTSSEDAAGWIESGQGGRWVVRFNTWNMANASGQAEFWDIHGDQNFQGHNVGQTSTMISEFYDNTIENAASTVYRWTDLRGSWGIFFDNTYSGASSPDIEVNQYAANNASTSGCYDQIVNYNGSTYVGPDLTIANSFFFNNKVNGTLTGAKPGSVNGCGVAENGAVSPYGTGVVYGWWNQQTGFNGTLGVGRGPKASMPSTCTPGVGYWVTDEGSWNTKLPPNTSGQFYKCMATGKWTLYYTPYTYPDPLLCESQGSPGNPCDLSGVAK